MNTCSSNPADTALYLFDPKKLQSLTKWNEIEKELTSRNLRARPLKQTDYDYGYLELLTVLTKVGDVSKSKFEERFKQMKQLNKDEDLYMIVVIEDLNTLKIVGASTLFLEYKFIHECAMRARLEEVAVLESYQGRQIGVMVVKIIIELAREISKTYKLSLDCSDELKPFYNKNGFKHEANMLCIRF